MISKEEIKKLGQLARIKIDEKEIDSLQEDTERILDFVSKLQEVDDKSVEKQIDISNAFRADDQAHKSGENSKSLLKQSPDEQDGFVKVKKVL